MATAIIITGQTRTLKHCFPTQREAIFRKLEDPYFFLSLADHGNDPAAIETFRQWVVGKYGENHWHEEIVTQPSLEADDQIRFNQAAAHAPWGISVPVEAIWRQFWHLARGWDFYRSTNSIEIGINFDRFLRIRPDLHVHNWTMPQPVATWDIHNLKGAPPSMEGVYAPWWGSWGGCPDRMGYIVGYAAAAQYFNVFHRINELLAEGCAFHPETMLARTLERSGIRLRQTLDAEFTTIRAEGDNRPHDAPSYSNRDVFRYVNERLAEVEP